MPREFLQPSALRVEIVLVGAIFHAIGIAIWTQSIWLSLPFFICSRSSLDSWSFCQRCITICHSIRRNWIDFYLLQCHIYSWHHAWSIVFDRAVHMPLGQPLTIVLVWQTFQNFYCSGLVFQELNVVLVLHQKLSLFNSKLLFCLLLRKSPDL